MSMDASVMVPAKVRLEHPCSVTIQLKAFKQTSFCVELLPRINSPDARGCVMSPTVFVRMKSIGSENVSTKLVSKTYVLCGSKRTCAVIIGARLILQVQFGPPVPGKHGEARDRGSLELDSIRAIARAIDLFVRRIAVMRR